MRGGAGYYGWLAFLAAWVLLGVVAYVVQLRGGLAVTRMTDEFAWGVYVGNFTFLVGTAAAAVMLVIPAHLFRHRALGEVVVFGELMAVVAVLMCMLFLFVDLGRPDRFWHMLPLLGRFHFPQSLLAWDVVVLVGYLLLNVYLSVKQLYAHFRGRSPTGPIYRVVVYVAIVWAISIHTVTAFLYSGLGARPYWNSAILAPHFLASAFTAGPALMILALWLVRRRLGLAVQPSAFQLLRRIAMVAMLVNLFLFGSEVFTAFYAGGAHAAGMHYHLFGLPGHRVHAFGTWLAVACEVVAVVILLCRPLHRRQSLLLAACGLAVGGVWIDKSAGVIVPGFIPSPYVGHIVDYTPSWVELSITAGIWAGGILAYTVLVKVAVALRTAGVGPA